MSSTLIRLRMDATEKLFDSSGVAQLVGHHRDVVKTVKVRESLGVGLVLDELFGAAMEQTNVGIGS